MVNVSKIYPLTHFLRNHKEHIARIKESRSPEVLTINRKAELVVLDPESYQAMQEKLHYEETLEAIREGLSAAARDELKLAEQVLAEMKAKYVVRG